MTPRSLLRRLAGAVLAAVSLVGVLAGCSLAGPAAGLDSPNLPVTPASTSTGSIRIVLRVGNETAAATLADTPAAREFAAMLPLELDLRDPMGQAKSGPLPRPLDIRGTNRCSTHRWPDLLLRAQQHVRRLLRRPRPDHSWSGPGAARNGRHRHRRGLPTPATASRFGSTSLTTPRSDHPHSTSPPTNSRRLSNARRCYAWPRRRPSRGPAGADDPQAHGCDHPPRGELHLRVRPLGLLGSRTADRAAADGARVRRHRRGGRVGGHHRQARTVRGRIVLRLRQHLRDLPRRLPLLLHSP